MSTTTAGPYALERERPGHAPVGPRARQILEREAVRVAESAAGSLESPRDSQRVSAHELAPSVQRGLRAVLEDDLASGHSSIVYRLRMDEDRPVGYLVTSWEVSDRPFARGTQPVVVRVSWFDLTGGQLGEVEATGPYDPAAGW